MSLLEDTSKNSTNAEDGGLSVAPSLNDAVRHVTFFWGRSAIRKWEKKYTQNLHKPT